MAQTDTQSATRWTCEQCSRSGVVTYPAPTSVYDVLYAIEDSHRAASPVCALDLTKVRVRAAHPNRSPK